MGPELLLQVLCLLRDTVLTRSKKTVPIGDLAAGRHFIENSSSDPSFIGNIVGADTRNLTFQNDLDQDIRGDESERLGSRADRGCPRMSERDASFDSPKLEFSVYFSKGKGSESVERYVRYTPSPRGSQALFQKALANILLIQQAHRKQTRDAENGRCQELRTASICSDLAACPVVELHRSFSTQVTRLGKARKAITQTTSNASPRTPYLWSK